MWYHLGVKSIYFNNDAMLFWMQFCLMMTFGWPIDGCGAAYIFWFEIYLVASVSIVMMWMTLYWNPKLIFSDWQSKYNDAYISFSMFMLHLFPDIIDLVHSFGFAYLLVDYGCCTCNNIYKKRYYKDGDYTFVCYSMKYARLFMQQFYLGLCLQNFRKQMDCLWFRKHMWAEWCIVQWYGIGHNITKFNLD